MTITDTLVRLLGAGMVISGLAALVIYAVNKWGDQGGIGEKQMMGALIAAVAFGVATAFIAVNGPTIFVTS